MRKGELGAVMYIIIGVLVLLAVTIVIISLKGKSFGLIDSLRGLG